MAGARTPTSDARTAAPAAGRADGRAVRRYLESLEGRRRRRGRQRTSESLERRLAEIELELATAAPLRRLHLLQERADRTTELQQRTAAVGEVDLETAFVHAAAGYGARQGITYSGWRELGVPARVLARAGIRRR